MFEVRDITVGDAGYYNGGTCAGAAWSGGGVLLIVNGNLFLRFHTVGLNLSITIPNWNNTYIEPFQVYVLIVSSTLNICFCFIITVWNFHLFGLNDMSWFELI